MKRDGLGSPYGGLWVPGGRLLVPASFELLRRQLVETEYMLVTLGLETLTGHRQPWGSIVESLRKHNRRAALTFLSTLDAVLENDGATKQETQLALASTLLPEDLFRLASQAIVQERRRVVFSNQPIWMLEKLVLAHAEPGGDASETEVGRRELATLLLALADYLDEDVRPTGSVASTNDNWELTRHLIRSAMLYASEDPGAMLPRIWTLVVDLPDQPALRTEPSWVDLAGLLMRHDGVDPKTYLAAGATLSTYYANISLLRKTTLNPALAPRRYYSSTKFGPEIWDRVSVMVGLQEPEYSAKIQEEDVRTGSPAFAFQTMRERPLVLYDDQILPLSQRFLKNKFTDGLLWVLRDRATRDGIGDKVSAFWAVCLSAISSRS